MVLAHNIQEGLRTQDVKISEDVTFDTMLLAANTLQGLNESGFHKPSPIQLHGIPLGKCGFDLLLEAKSGTGKTAVFSVIALEKLNLSKGLQTVILAPTREIAAQICDVIKQIGAGYQNLCVEVVMGGLPVQDDIAKFKKKTHIVVGSPGRLRHLIQDNHIDISAVRLLVLDEADKLMDKSFRADINYIFSILPKQKQVIMSSATYPEVLQSIINKYVSNAQHICPDSTSILLGIKQLFTVVKSNSNIVRQTQLRFEELLNILSKKKFKQCLIFCNYQVRVGELGKMLKREKWPAEQLHGQQDQTDRLEALKTLQQYKCRILISTDLAARGIDASNVDMVINFEPPFEWQTYLHRIGRAGRFGSYGIAITILSEGQEQKKFKKMLESISVSLKLSNVWDDNEIFYDSPTSETNSITSIKTNLEQQQERDDNVLSVSVTNRVTCLHTDLEQQPGHENFNDLPTSVTSSVTCLQIDLEEQPEIDENFNDLPTSVTSSVTCLQMDLEQQTESHENINDLPASVTKSCLLTDLEQQIVRGENFKTETNYEEFWDALTQKHDESNTEIFNFGDLNKSFEDTKESEIQSFIELITSFEVQENCSENIPYQHMKFQTISVDDGLLALIDNTKSNPKFSDASDNQIMNIPKLEEIELVNRHNSVSMNTNQNSRFTEFKNKLKEKLKRKLQIQSNVEDEEVYEYTQNLNKALMEAGLPTAFGGKKYNGRKTDSNYTKTKYSNHPGDYETQPNKNGRTNTKFSEESKDLKKSSKASEHEINYDVTQSYPFRRLNNSPLMEASLITSFDGNITNGKKCNRNIISDANENSLNKNEPSENMFTKVCTYQSNSESSEDETNDVYNNQSYSSSKSVNDPNCYKNTSKQRNDYSQNTHMATSERVNSYVMHKKYNTWYNQLKTHIKQVEMYAYFEQLAKIK